LRGGVAMPAVQHILSTINQFAQARLPVMGGRRGAGLAGRTDPLARPELPDAPESTYARAGPEPPLEEMLDDPVVQRIMQADGVQPTDLQHLLETAQRGAAPSASGVIRRPR
jgi:hypothetical protein